MKRNDLKKYVEHLKVNYSEYPLVKMIVRDLENILNNKDFANKEKKQ